MKLIEDIENAVEKLKKPPQEVIDFLARKEYITADQAALARDYFERQSEIDSLNNANKELEDKKAKSAKAFEAKKEAERIKTPIGQRDLLQWNPNISPVTNILAHPLAAFSAGVDKVVSAIRPPETRPDGTVIENYPNRTFRENYDLAMEKYQKKNPFNPRDAWDDVAMAGTEMLGEGLATAGIAPAFTILKSGIAPAFKILKDTKKLAQAAKPLKDATNALLAYATPQWAQTAKPLKDAAQAVSELPTLYTNPYFRGAVENAVFAGIDPELSKVDVATNVVAGLGATKALTNMPLLTGKKTRKGFIDDGLVGVRQVIDAPKQGPHAARYEDALPWVLENLETRHWHGGGPGKTLQNLEKSAGEAMETALRVPARKPVKPEQTIEEIDKFVHHAWNPKTYTTKIAKKATDVKEQLSARVDDAIANLTGNVDVVKTNIDNLDVLIDQKHKGKEHAFETLSYVYDEAMKLVNSNDIVLKLTGKEIIANRDARLRSVFGEEGAKKIQEALFKKSVVDSYKTRINLGEINAAKKDIHQVAKEHVFTPFIKAASLGEGPNALVRTAYPIVKGAIQNHLAAGDSTSVKGGSNKNIDWLKSFTQPFYTEPSKERK